MKADLHVHSTASDGTLTPADLVALALERGLRVLAIADHDSVEGLPEALEAAEAPHLTLVPARRALRGRRRPRRAHPRLLRRSRRRAAATASRRPARPLVCDRAETMVRAARQRRATSWTSTTCSRSRTAAPSAGATSHAHWSTRGTPRRFETPSSGSSAADGPSTWRKTSERRPRRSTVIRDAGGSLSSRTPASARCDDLIGGMVEAGLGGIEAYHADHTPEQRAPLRGAGARERAARDGRQRLPRPCGAQPGAGRSRHARVHAIAALLRLEARAGLAPERERVLHSLPPCAPTLSAPSGAR